MHNDLIHVLFGKPLQNGYTSRLNKRSKPPSPICLLDLWTWIVNFGKEKPDKKLFQWPYQHQITPLVHAMCSSFPNNKWIKSLCIRNVLYLCATNGAEYTTVFYKYWRAGSHPPFFSCVIRKSALELRFLFLNQMNYLKREAWKQMNWGES